MAAKIAIVVPSHEYAPIRFAADLTTMALYSREVLPPDIEIGMGAICHTYIHSARREIIKMGMAAKCTHLLWLDSDMRFPADTLIRLLNHQKPMVGINYCTRQFPAGFVAFERLNENESIRLRTTAESTGLVPVDALGFGVLLMDLTKIKKILPPLSEDPWFGFDWKPDGNEVGEDVHFCFMVRKRGIQPYVDQDLSKECGHIGVMTYTTGMVPVSEGVMENARAAKAREQVTVA